MKRKLKGSDWILEGDPSYELRRHLDEADEHKPRSPVSQPKFGEGKPPPELLDRSRLRHSDIRVLSLIDTAKWDQAKWRGVLFEYTNDVKTYPPVLALLFENEDAARDIFAALKSRLGDVDERNALRVAIIRGISVANPSHYAVVVGSALNFEAAAGTQVLCVSRINRMSPQSAKNLEQFLNAYERSGCYLLAAAVSQANDKKPELLREDVIGKYELEVRDAWRIGRNDPDVQVLDPDDPPVIPMDVGDAPVLKALDWLMTKGRRGPADDPA